MNFDQKICNLLIKIPKGKVSTYKSLAEALNCKAYRAVGNALNKNKSPEKYPCFKIINSSGFVGQYKNGQKTKIRLLKKEGIHIKNNKINLGKYLYKFK